MLGEGGEFVNCIVVVELKWHFLVGYPSDV